MEVKTMTVSRRNFLKYTGVLAGATALTHSGLLSLKELTPEEASAIEKAMEGYEIRYTADAMCPAECGLEMWIKMGSKRKFTATRQSP